MQLAVANVPAMVTPRVGLYCVNHLAIPTMVQHTGTNTQTKCKHKNAKTKHTVKMLLAIQKLAKQLLPL